MECLWNILFTKCGISNQPDVCIHDDPCLSKFGALRGSCPHPGVSDTAIPSSELLYIGFWTDKGNADTKTLQLLSQLKNKQIFLFGTAGFGGSDIYFRKILSQVKQFIDASNVIVGEYMCQGRMPQSVRERYLKMKEAPDHPANLDVLIQNFDCALSHPDANDLEKLKEAVMDPSL